MLPHVIEYSGIAILTYGVLRLLAFAVALWFGVSLTERADIRRDILMRFGLVTLLVEVASPKFSLRYMLLVRAKTLSSVGRRDGYFD